MTKMMKCGHSANATELNGTPCCVICAGIDSGYNQPADIPDLTNRQAKCVYCKKPIPSSTELAFFMIHPNKEYDEYYCGCRGWD